MYMVFPSFPFKKQAFWYTPKSSFLCLLRHLSFQSSQHLWCILFSLQTEENGAKSQFAIFGPFFPFLGYFFLFSGGGRNLYFAYFFSPDASPFGYKKSFRMSRNSGKEGKLGKKTKIRKKNIYEAGMLVENI